MVVRPDGSLCAAGNNLYGQLGDSSNTRRVEFVQAMPDGAKAVAAAEFFTVVLKTDDSVWATGRNNVG